ncbi:MAG: RNA 2'-phosphotransferase [Candidatus Omnitrophota bacterium]|nr:MAG: RNA 2'-phosphotransferase [Candidatus Omnitrophota bacterium]RKY46088.1 MAG: RNA 2'-phosphotransferase [Candidatus Omnitrophota bacterium]
MSYLLRHNPSRYGIEIDEYGYAELDRVVSIIRKRFPFIDREFIVNLVEKSSKKRFQIKGDKIRALYGHSIEVEINYPTITPPQILYHGTNVTSLGSILKEGLKPMRRKKVHLSKSLEEAVRVGKRKGLFVVVLKIEAKRAYEKGIKFYDGGDVVLVDYLPPEFISVHRIDL